MFFLFIIFLILIDQSTKYLAYKFLAEQNDLVIKEGLLRFSYLENKGAAFGILQNKGIIFLIITIIVVVVLLSILFDKKRKPSKMLKLSIALILGGTFGNFIDRLRLHYVIDFISVRIFGHDFAVFNLADVFIVCGTFLLVIMIIFHSNENENKDLNKNE